MYIIDKVTLDEERHEAVIQCNGHLYRVTEYDCNRLGITQGIELSDSLFEKLNQAESRLACIQKAFTHLSYGDLSKKRLIDKLRRSFEPKLCREIADLMEERGYINDLSLATRYADNYNSLRLYGPLRIKQELFGKGFTREVIDEVMEPYLSVDHRDSVRELLEQKFLRYRSNDPSVKKKAAAWLNRQGYSWSDISDVLNEFFSQID